MKKKSDLVIRMVIRMICIYNRKAQGFGQGRDTNDNRNDLHLHKQRQEEFVGNDDRNDNRNDLHLERGYGGNGRSDQYKGTQRISNPINILDIEQIERSRTEAYTDWIRGRDSADVYASVIWWV